MPHGVCAENEQEDPQSGEDPGLHHGHGMQKRADRSGSHHGGRQPTRKWHHGVLGKTKQEQSKYDIEKRRLRCHLFIECRENYYPKEFSPAIVGAVSSSAYVSDLINDASYTKLREISLSYNLPGSFASRLGAARASVSIAGRNLHTWTNYKGLEPEASFQGGTRGFGQWEQDVTPQLRSFIGSLRLNF